MTAAVERIKTIPRAGTSGNIDMTIHVVLSADWTIMEVRKAVRRGLETTFDPPAPIAKKKGKRT